MPCIYILKSQQTGKYYIGSTNNIQRRLQEHRSGSGVYTRGRGPWELIYSEEKKTLKEARKREMFFKTGDGRCALKRILEKI